MSAGHWTFLSNHSHVLVCIARDPTVRVRDIASDIGITERAVLRIISELKDAGYLDCDRVGRRNNYYIWLDKELRHELESGVTIRKVLKPLVKGSSLSTVDAAQR